MFGNRVLLIRSQSRMTIEKEVPNGVVGSETTDYDSLIRTLVSGSIAVVVAYMGADTLRKIIVHTVATKIN